MVTLVLNAEQAKVVKDAREAVELIDAVGTRLGIVARPPSDAEVETALARLEIEQPPGSARAQLMNLEFEEPSPSML